MINSWNDICGNARLKRELQALIRCSRNPATLRRKHLLITGLSRSGKTSGIEFGVSAMLCHNPTTELEPCGICATCQGRNRSEGFRHGDWCSCGPENLKLLFVALDGNTITREELSAELLEASQTAGFHFIFHLDEVQGLVRRHLDHDLLNPIDRIENVTWLVSTATLENVDQMFLNRFTRVATELPNCNELAVYLARLCQRREFNLTWDADEVLIHLARQSRQVPGVAVQCLEWLNTHETRVITREAVSEFFQT